MKREVLLSKTNSVYWN